MSRNRLLKKEFFRDQRVGALSFGARLLFQSLWIEADDSGNGRADVRLLRSEGFPYDDISVSDVEGMFAEIVKSGMVRAYEVGGTKFYHVVHFSRHQTIDRPSKFRHPSPPWLGDNSDEHSSEHSDEQSSNTRRAVVDESKSKSEKSSQNVNEERESKRKRRKETDADCDRTDRSSSFDDIDLTRTDVTCLKKLTGGLQGLYRFTGLDPKKFGNNVDPRFSGKFQTVYVNYSLQVHADGDCDCSAAEFLNEVIETCTEQGIKYPRGVLARLKELQRVSD